MNKELIFERDALMTVIREMIRKAELTGIRLSNSWDTALRYEKEVCHDEYHETPSRLKIYEDEGDA